MFCAPRNRERHRDRHRDRNRERNRDRHRERNREICNTKPLLLLQKAVGKADELLPVEKNHVVDTLAEVVAHSLRSDAGVDRRELVCHKRIVAI